LFSLKTVKFKYFSFGTGIDVDEDGDDVVVVVEDFVVIIKRFVS
jgi:hypothetical protein